MASVEYNRVQERKKDGSLVIPMDTLRTVEYQTKNFISGEYPGSGFYPIASGKVGYLKQALITNYSGIYPVQLVWGDAATAASGHWVSGACQLVHLVISSGNAMGGTTFHEFIPALGPYQSGICLVSGGAQIAGTVTAVIQLDPQARE